MPTLIHLTAQYSNAVLMAVMPYVSDFAAKLDLPLPKPLTTNQVHRIGGFKAKEDLSGHIVLTNGYTFWFSKGYIDTFEAPGNYFVEQDPDNIHKYLGENRMKKDEAVQLARDAVRRLGIPTKPLNIDRKPDIRGPEKFQGKTIPFYRIDWFDPKTGDRTCTADVDGQHKRLLKLFLNARELSRPPPKIDVQPELLSDYRKRMLGTNTMTRTNAPLKKPALSPHRTGE